MGCDGVWHGEHLEDSEYVTNLVLTEAPPSGRPERYRHRGPILLNDEAAELAIRDRRAATTHGYVMEDERDFGMRNSGTAAMGTNERQTERWPFPPQPPQTMTAATHGRAPWRRSPTRVRQRIREGRRGGHRADHHGRRSRSRSTRRRSRSRRRRSRSRRRARNQRGAELTASSLMAALAALMRRGRHGR